MADVEPLSAGFGADSAAAGTDSAGFGRGPARSVGPSSDGFRRILSTFRRIRLWAGRAGWTVLRGLLVLLALLASGRAAARGGEPGPLAILLTVLDDQGKARAEQRLELYRKQPDGRYRRVETAYLARPGKPTFRGLPPGEYRLDARPWEGDNWQGSVAFTLAMPEDGVTVALTMTVHPAPVLAVQVVDRRGTPQPDMEVAIRSVTDPEELYSGYTDDDGRLAMAELRRGREYRAEVQSANRRDVRSLPELDAAGALNFVMTPRLERTLVVHRIVRPPLTLRLVAPDGTSAPADVGVPARVGYQPTMLVNGPMAMEIAEGEYALTPMVTSGPWHLAPGQPVLQVAADAAPEERDVRVQRGRPVAITMVHLDGARTRGAGHYTIRGEGYAGLLEGDILSEDGAGQGPSQRLQLLLPPGEFEISVAIAGLQRTTVPLRVPAEPAAGPTALQVPMRRGLALSATVRSNAADPVVAVTVRQSLGQTARAEVAAGGVTLVGLSRELLELGLVYASGACHWLDLPANVLDAPETTLTAPPTVPVALVFEVADRPQFHGASRTEAAPCGFLHVLRGTEREQIVATVPLQLTGTRILRLPPGEYRLVWEARNPPYGSGSPLGRLAVPAQAEAGAATTVRWPTP